MISIFGGAEHAFHGDAAERLHVLGGAMRNQRLGVFHCSTKHHPGRIGDAFMQVIGDIAGLLAGSLMQAVAPAMNSARVSGFTVSVATRRSRNPPGLCSGFECREQAL